MTGRDLIAKAAAVLRLSRDRLRLGRSNLIRADLPTKVASGMRLRRDDLVRVVRVLVAAVVCLAFVVVIASVPGWGATHGLLGIHEAPAARTTSAPMTVDQAKSILARVFTAAYLGETTTGAAAGEQRRTAYTGQGLRGVEGRVKLASVQPAVTTSPLLAPHPKLLAVSRGFGFPRFIVAQTVASDGGLPVLHLLVSPDAATPYRISMSVEMVPPATVQPFDRLTSGSPLVANGTGPLVTKSAGLAVAPDTLLSLYAAKMAFPAKAVSKPPFAQDSFSGQLQSGAAAAAAAVSTQASFTQVHKVVPDSVYAVRVASGDALVFGVLERTDSFAVKTSQNVNTAANKAFVLLTGKKLITQSASITTLEFVVFSVPQSTGQAQLVAAREQIVAGSGS
jgi:hypothetical protein